MKKVLLLSAAILALAAPVASAQGINLSFNDCGASGLPNFNQACTANSGAMVMVTSVVSPAVPNFVGAELVLDLQVDAPTLPDWFQLAAGGCRAGKLIASFDFTGGPFSCNDPWAGQAFGGIDYSPGFGGANRARIKTGAALAVGVPLSAGDEWYLSKATVLFSTNNITCAGCTTPACIVFNSVKLAQPAGQGDFVVSNAANSQHVTYQGGGTLQCPGATPTESNSWGEIKAMYR